jgi:hypothetical protein
MPDASPSFTIDPPPPAINPDLNDMQSDILVDTDGEGAIAWINDGHNCCCSQCRHKVAYIQECIEDELKSLHPDDTWRGFLIAADAALDLIWVNN